MVKIDLITGFLGSGKTTFIKKYAAHLLDQGLKIGILENDFGAVNVDTMLLSEMEGENCDLEMISGGCDPDCHKRRFKTKLIALGMTGLDYVLVEPSGIYETDEFFDTLHEEPLDRWYEIGNVIAIVDADLEKQQLSGEAEYLLASQIASAGKILLSRSQEVSQNQIEHTIDKLNDIMKKYGCKRRFGEEVISKDWRELSIEDFSTILSSGYIIEDYARFWFHKEKEFNSLYFMNVRMSEENLRIAAEKIFRGSSCGRVFRIKGFIMTPEGNWIEINAVYNQIITKTVKKGQEILIVIGEGLVQKTIDTYLSFS